MDLTLSEVLESAGVFAYPLLACSILALAVLIERFISLFCLPIFPNSFLQDLITGDLASTEANPKTAGGRILKFYRESSPDADGLKAFAKLEVSRLERGIFLLDTVVSVSPLLGLLGTVTGLVSVFSGFDANAPFADTAQFGKGISLALSTTILGLSIAIPALVGATWLDRRVDVLAARIEAGVERILESSKGKETEE
jgi:biopolymer transport protein ExbB